MNKKDYQLFAEVVAKVTDETERERLVNFLSPIFSRDNERYSEDRFREFVDRRVKGESLKGLNVNPKYLYQ